MLGESYETPHGTMKGSLRDLPSRLPQPNRGARFVPTAAGSIEGTLCLLRAPRFYRMGPEMKFSLFPSSTTHSSGRNQVHSC